MRLRPLVYFLTAFISVGRLVTANLDGPPPGYTGAPGEETCAVAACHDLPSSHTGFFRLLPTSESGPDTLGFDLLLIDSNSAPAGDVWGFELTAVDSFGQAFGDLVVADSVRTKVTSGLDEKTYLRQTATGALGTHSNGARWTFRWAPPPGTDPAKRLYLYVAGLIADGDGTKQGDAVVTSVFLKHPYYCPVLDAGDATCDLRISSADIIKLVSYIFKGGAHPCPCEGAGDANCNGAVTTADVIVLVNYVFKSGPTPCDVCPLILDGTWDC